MLDALHWRALDAAVLSGPGKLDDGFLTQFREAAYRGEAPWVDPAIRLSARTKGVLLADMARHAGTVEEVTATFWAMDEAQLNRGQAWITADAGDILIERARHHQLPEGWMERVSSLGLGHRPSAAYWARAALHAGGHRVVESEAADRRLA